MKMNNSDFRKVLTKAVSGDITSGDVTVVIQPYIDVTIQSGDSTSLTLEIDVKYL